MTEYEMMKAMLQRVAPNSTEWLVFEINEEEQRITLCCSDEYYDRDFYFENGQLVKLD